MKAVAIVALAGLALTGCAGQSNILPFVNPQATLNSSTGSAHFEVNTKDGRSVQYVCADINLIKVTVMDADNSNAVLAAVTYSGASLASHLVSNKFSFEVDNLKVNDGTHPTYHYLARVDAYLETAQVNLIGSSTTSSTFTVTSGQLTNVNSFPALALIATPVGNATATGSNAVSILDNPAPAISFK